MRHLGWWTRDIGSGLRPCRREVAEPIESAQVARLAERPIEDADGVAAYRLPVVLKHEVRRSEQADERLTREPRLDELENQVKGGRERLGGEGQRVRRLI